MRSAPKDPDEDVRWRAAVALGKIVMVEKGGDALELIADRKNDAVAAETALRQIETAYETA